MPRTWARSVPSFIPSPAKPPLVESKPMRHSPALLFLSPQHQEGSMKAGTSLQKEREDSFFFPAPLYRLIWLWRYGKVSLPKQVSLSKTYSLISWSCLNLRVGCASWFLAHSYISGNFCPSLTSIIGSLWHTALQDLNRLLFFPYTERELCARDSLNCTAQPFINGLNNEQSI